MKAGRSHWSAMMVGGVTATRSGVRRSASCIKEERGLILREGGDHDGGRLSGDPSRK